MKKLSIVLTVLVLMLFAAGLTFVITFSTLDRYFGVDSSSAVGRKTAELYEYLNRYYVDDVDAQALADAASDAMVNEIGDEWSYYIPADEYAAYLERLDNAYVGVGLTVQQDVEAGVFTVVNVIPGGPADAAGVAARDVIYEVNGTPVEGMEMEQLRDLVRGEENTTVTLSFLRDGEVVTFDIVRHAIEEEVVHAELLSCGVGYLKIDNFDGGCAEKSIAAISRLREQGAKSILFDVRYNPGGLKIELVALLDYLLPEGEVFHAVDYSGEEEFCYSDASYLDMPMAVLVNVDSYSAAEFFAATLQEYGAASVVGVQTYGKGRFQQALRMSDGSAVNLSIGTYYTPQGKNLAGVGITPDYVVELDDDDLLALAYDTLAHEDDEQLQKAIEILAG